MVSIAGLALGVLLNTITFEHRALGSVPVDKQCSRFLSELNQAYGTLTENMEDGYWLEAMGIISREQQISARALEKLNAFFDDKQVHDKVHENLVIAKNSLPADHPTVTGLEGFARLLEVNSAKTPELAQARLGMKQKDDQLGELLRKVTTGYTDPYSGQFIRATTIGLRMIVDSNHDEKIRRAAFEGLKDFEHHVVSPELVEAVKVRNQVAREKLGPDANYYDYSLSQTERISSHELFALLDHLEEKTREAALAAKARLEQRFGGAANLPWNRNYYSGLGPLIHEVDTYFPLSKVLQIWGQTFSALGVDYRKGVILMDLLDRAGKTPNGFMHVPVKAYVDENGIFHPARVGICSNGVVGQPGAGFDATRVILHEGGHMAHFCNIEQPARAYSTEHPPASTAHAELQAMFFEHLMSDPNWLVRYPRNERGEGMPEALLRKVVQALHDEQILALRRMMVMPFFERRLYRLSQAELTAENILRIAREEEERLVFGLSARPTLTINHITEYTSSAYYHSYVLAQLAVYQTHAYLSGKFGSIVDNPAVGPWLVQNYWQDGNRKGFFDFVAHATQKKLSLDDALNEILKSADVVNKDVDEALVRQRESKGSFPHNYDVNAEIVIEDGGRPVIGQTSTDLTKASQAYGNWIQSLEKAAH